MNARGCLFAAVMLVVTMGTALLAHGRLIAGFDYGSSGSPVQQDFTEVEISTNVTTDASGEATITGDHTGGTGGAVILWNGFEITFDDPAGTVIVIK